jgi:hypothetical protein
MFFLTAVSLAIIVGVTAAVVGLVPQWLQLPIFSAEFLTSEVEEIFNSSNSAADSQFSSPPRPSVGVAAPTTEPGSPFEQPPPATAIDRIHWQEIADTTVVAIEANGRIDEASFGHLLMTHDPQPRLIVYLYGIGSGGLAYRQMVGGARLDAIRVWYHREKSPSQLHVVLDFAHPNVVVQEPYVEGTSLLVTLSNQTTYDE